MTNPLLAPSNIFISSYAWYCCAVVSQLFVTETHNTYVIVGNSALFKCEIPGYVADFVAVVGWIGGDGKEFFTQSEYGNLRRLAHTFVRLQTSAAPLILYVV